VSEYLLINIGIIAGPLILSFDNKVRFYKKLPYVLFSMTLVGLIYILWDIYATADYHWSFNPLYTGSIYIFGLPVEEILFFITVPYAMLFLYEVFRYYLEDKITIRINLVPAGFILSVILIITGILMLNYSYTAIAVFSCAAYFLIASALKNKYLSSGIFWIFILFSFIPFFIFNYLLTSLPVVLYNPEAILGYRVLTIPIEDFFYSFSLISFYVMAYTVSMEYSLLKRNNRVIVYDQG
jgi:lycopene cyclase domain-containing protein